ncbi:MAG: hypothetical protein HQK59_13165 [Deltaproteobacteria bacterium]|nr:hypothetical protein [Deltaproteobacteria bacterium]
MISQNLDSLPFQYVLYSTRWPKSQDGYSHRVNVAGGTSNIDRDYLTENLSALSLFASLAVVFTRSAGAGRILFVDVYLPAKKIRCNFGW